MAHTNNNSIPEDIRAEILRCDPSSSASDNFPIMPGMSEIQPLRSFGLYVAAISPIQPGYQEGSHGSNLKHLEGQRSPASKFWRPKVWCEIDLTSPVKRPMKTLLSCLPLILELSKGGFVFRPSSSSKLSLSEQLPNTVCFLN